MPQPVIVAGARTPIGKLLGALAPLTAPQLAGAAITAALDRAGITGDQVDTVFFGNVVQAGVALASARDLGVSPERVNVNGGAIALGHPVAMSGARLVLTLALELRRRGGGTGAAALCGGGGQGDALILRVLEAQAR
jgi:acetyl-CoA C-acetyltransferase